MFYTGDVVECVDDTPDFGEDPIGWMLARIAPAIPISKGERFTVQGVILAGTRWGDPGRGCVIGEDGNDYILIGVENPQFRCASEVFDIAVPHCDVWSSARFRKITEQKRSVREIVADMLPAPSKEIENA